MTYEISDAEWRVMHVIWDRQPVGAHDVVAVLTDSTDWSPATIKTMLHRLVKKKILTHASEGNRYIYRAAVKREQCTRLASLSFLERVFSGETAPMLACFVKSGKLSKKDIAQLKQLLDEQETGR
ncbi:MAG: BlaI/MecI/CopY family transcriptional regulator [Planctomycetaceae bacterium]